MYAAWVPTASIRLILVEAGLKRTYVLPFVLPWCLFLSYVRKSITP